MEPRGHALFTKLQAETHIEQHSGFSKGAAVKPLLAPKGEYWDTAEDKVLGMFRTKLEAGLTEQEVLARRDVYGDNRPPPVPTNSVLKILLRQLMDFIVLILLAGGWVGGWVHGECCGGGGGAFVCVYFYYRSTDTRPRPPHPPTHTHTHTAAIVSAALQDIKTAIVLAIVIGVNTVIGFYQASERLCLFF